MSESVELNVDVKSPIERVWHALTDPVTLGKWMMFTPRDFKPVVGHTFQFEGTTGWNVAIDCEVLDVKEPHRLSYTWVTQGQDEQPHSTVVTWTLTETGDGSTHLHFEQSGFRSGAKQEFGGARAGWKRMLDTLQDLVANA